MPAELIAPGLPMLTLTGARDYAREVPACERPTAYVSSGPGNKLMHFSASGTHASVALSDEDNATVDFIASEYWTRDRCTQTSALRGTDDFGPMSPKTTTALELELYAALAAAVIPFLQAVLDGDAGAGAMLAATPEHVGGLSTFDFATTRLERRGAIGGIAKLLSPRGVVIDSAECGNEVSLRVLRRSMTSSLSLDVTGLPSPATVAVSAVAADATTATMIISRNGAAAGTYLVRVTGAAADGLVLGTQLRVTFE